tara:strand:- start:763 stop:1677 length:915 start_codon:yes stop_codon:yes gene_type:complete
MTTLNGRMKGKKADYVKPEQVIVNELIEALESGNTKLWRKEWTIKGGFRNVLSGHQYKGSNPALLCLQSSIRNWHLPLFIGGGQARSINCTIKKGSRSARILQPLLREYETKEVDVNGEAKKAQYMSYKCVPVFNIADVRGLDDEASLKLEKLIDDAVLTAKPRELDVRVKEAHDRLFQWEKEVKAVIKGGDRAYYRPSTDEIVIPKRYNFKNDESYLSTFAHECIHSTMKRLNRKDLTYAQEELVAELGAYLICNRLQISNLDTMNHAAYLESWCPMLKSDPKILFKSLANASKAADMVIGEQ